MEICARRLGAGPARPRGRVRAGPGHQRAEDVRPAPARARGPRLHRRAPAREAAAAGARRARGPRAPDVGGAAPARAQARVAARQDLAPAAAAPGGPRAAAARVRHPAGRLGASCCAPASWRATRRCRASARRRGRTRRRCASCSTRRARCTPCCATSRSSPASAARGSTRSSTSRGSRRSSAATTCRTTEADALRAAMTGELGRVIDHYEAAVQLPLPGEVPQADARARPPGRALPELRDGARGGLLRGLRHDVLPALPDGGPRPQGPPALAPAEVVTPRDADGSSRRRTRRAGRTSRPCSARAALRRGARASGTRCGPASRGPRSAPRSSRYRLRAQTDCGHPGPGATSGLGRLPRRRARRLVRGRAANRLRAPAAQDPRSLGGRAEDKADDSVWAVTCFHPRRLPPPRRQPRARARAAVGFARERGARALEGYPMITEPGGDVIGGQSSTSARRRVVRPAPR